MDKREPETGGMDTRERINNEIARRMGPDFFTGKAPRVFEYDTYRLQKRAKNEGLFRKLEKIYSGVPGVTCGSCGDVCCRESPDVYLLEYLHIWRHIHLEMKDEKLEAEVLRRSLEWAFLHYVKPDTFCPFLVDRQCVIYDARPLNCRLWALENEGYYNGKADRARASISRQEQFFKKHGIVTARPMEEYVLPKCEWITVEGGRSYSEDEIVGMDLEAAFLHLALIPHKAFKSLNFHLHFPGHLAMKKVAPEKFDSVCVNIALEYNRNGESQTLENLVNDFSRQLP